MDTPPSDRCPIVITLGLQIRINETLNSSIVLELLLLLGPMIHAYMHTYIGLSHPRNNGYYGSIMVVYGSIIVVLL